EEGQRRHRARLSRLPGEGRPGLEHRAARQPGGWLRRLLGRLQEPGSGPERGEPGGPREAPRPLAGRPLGAAAPAALPRRLDPLIFPMDAPDETAKADSDGAKADSGGAKADSGGAKADGGEYWQSRLGPARPVLPYVIGCSFPIAIVAFFSLY